ncbi:MAG: IS110 family transposase [Thermoplasmata archaeon]
MELDTYVGLDLSKTSTMATAVDPLGHRIEPAKLEPTDEALLDFLRALPPSRQHIVLEACNVSEHVYDAAASTGAEVLLANPPQAKLITKATLKTDKVDSEKLARLDAVPESDAPPPEVRQLRRCCRERVFYKKTWTSVANHTYAILLQKGIPYEAGLLGKKRRREELRSNEILEVNRGLDALAKIEELLRPLERSLQEEFVKSKEAQLVATVPGVGPVTAMTLVAFLCPIERFDDLDAVVKYCGLCPSTSQTGESSYTGHLVKDGQSVLKWVLIEAQWQTRRLEKKGDVAKVGRRVAKRLKAADGAVAAARKLVRICASVLRRGTPYEREAPGSSSRHALVAEP